MKVLKFLFIFLVLTILTQIGGVLYLILLFLNKKYNIEAYFKLLFIGSYCLLTFICIPFIAPWFGREQIIHSTYVKPVSIVTILLNRNYVAPEMIQLLKLVSDDIKESQVRIQYLDANFPFWNGFPLLPHLSHKDGLKLDISLIYESKNGEISQLKKSNSGYGVFESPRPEEFNQVKACHDHGYYQYDYPKYLTFGEINKDLKFSKVGTKLLLQAFLKQRLVEKIFIEPHLKRRMGLNHSKLRYHGCQAVRHDDHIHIQIKY